MMDIFDKISDAVVNAGKAVGDKGKGVYDLAKTKLDIKAQEDLLQKKYAELGEKYYEEKKNAKKQIDPELFEEIGAAIAKLNELNESILDATGAIVCPECGTKISAETKFCPECGAKQELPEEEEEVSEETAEETTEE